MDPGPLLSQYNATLSSSRSKPTWYLQVGATEYYRWAINNFHDLLGGEGQGQVQGFDLRLKKNACSLVRTKAQIPKVPKLVYKSYIHVCDVLCVTFTQLTLDVCLALATF